MRNDNNSLVENKIEYLNKIFSQLEIINHEPTEYNLDMMKQTLSTETFHL